MEETIGIVLKDWLISLGMTEKWAVITKVTIIVASISIICVIANWLTKVIIHSVLSRIVKKTKNNWDDTFLKRRVFHRFSHLVPAFIIYYTSSTALAMYPDWVLITHKAVYIYLIFTAIRIIYVFFHALNDIYQQYPSSKDRPIKGYLQVVNIIAYFIGGILILSVMLDKNPGYFLTGLGAILAVLLLVFKDSLLGLVAGIQLSSNNMVRIGDWIAIPSKQVEGVVTEISLHTVKLENFDKTISMLPSYTMVSEPFINFRGINDAGARRIRRFLNIDMKTIRFLTESDIQKLSKIHLLTDYLSERSTEIEQYNLNLKIDTSVPVNGRRLTNIGTFRKYVENYLKTNKNLKPDMTLIVRQLQPAETGLPLELYFFTSVVEWEGFEEVQSDIFDHLLAILPEFGLSVYQLGMSDERSALKNK